jgi:exopolysaccharide production protein ExoQ
MSLKNIGPIRTPEVEVSLPAEARSWGKIQVPSVDCLIAIGLTSSMLAISQLAGIAVGLFVIFTAAAFAYRRRQVIENVNFRILSILLVLGMVSSIWSLEPRATLYYGAQTITTVLAGVIIGSSPKAYDSLVGVTITLIVHTLISHVLGKYALWENGETVFVGIVGSKNYYGCVGGMTVLTSIGLAYAAINRDHKVLASVAMLGVVAGALGLVRSKATGFTLSAVACSAIIIYFNVYRVLTPRVRLGLTIYLVYAAICLTIGLSFLKDDIMRIVLHAAHKDVTLTGRTEIWDIGRAAISKRFWLGYGQDSFWVVENPYAQQIWRLHHMAPTRTFPLHNTYLEVRASLGVVGLGAYILVFGVLVIRQLAALIRGPSIAGITWLAVGFYFMFLMGVESFHLSPMNYNTLFLPTALTFVAFNQVNRKPKVNV